MDKDYKKAIEYVMFFLVVIVLFLLKSTFNNVYNDLENGKKEIDKLKIENAISKERIKNIENKIEDFYEKVYYNNTKTDYKN